MGFLLMECENITLNSVLMTAAHLSASQSGLCLLQGRTVLQYTNRGQVPGAMDEQQTSPPQMDKHRLTGGLRLHQYDINSTYTALNCIP